LSSRRPERTRDHGDDRLVALATEIAELAELVRKEGPALWKRARQSTDMVLPGAGEAGRISSGGGTDRIATLVAARLDAHPFVGEGDQCEQCKATRNHPDHHVIVDPVREHWFATWDAMSRARDELVTAQKHIVATLRPEPRLFDPDQQCCVSHLRIGVRTPEWKSGRCWWCWNERRLLGTSEDVEVERLRAYEDRKAARTEGKETG
jgi:hypothetical protein